MRPTPTETASALRRVLKEVVAPELTSDHAKQRLEEVRVVLGQIDWDDAGLALRARVEALQELVGAPLVPGSTYADLQGQHERLAALAVQQLAEQPDDPQLREALVQLLLT